jgi:hypothetical protein
MSWPVPLFSREPFKQQLIRRIVRNIAVSVDETDDPGAIHKENAGHLSDISNGFARRISRLPGPNPPPPHSRTENLKDRTGLQAVGHIRRALGIGETRERHVLLTTESARLLHIPLTDEHDFSSSCCEPVVVASQPGDVLSAEGSAEVAQEDKDDRPTGPERGETDAVTIAANQFDIRSSVTNSEHSLPLAAKISQGAASRHAPSDGRRHPFTTPIGRSRATRRAIPAASTTRATSFTSL